MTKTLDTRRWSPFPKLPFNCGAFRNEKFCNHEGFGGEWVSPHFFYRFLFSLRFRNSNHYTQLKLLKIINVFSFLSSTGIKIITGGPGTGKSTVINGLIHAYQKLHPYSRIALMAPTGRAAQRMREITGLKAGTIHKTLNIKPHERNDSLFSASYIHDFPAGLIIIDEASMLDEQLSAVMFMCFKEDATVILVGDVDQLPSIGAGKVLEDLLKCKVDSEPIERVSLIVNHRQKTKQPLSKMQILSTPVTETLKLTIALYITL